jgi:hypothetical protein
MGRNASGNTRGKFKGECNNCGKIGHKKYECWKLEENKSNRPKDYRLGNAEHGNAAISGGARDNNSYAEFSNVRNVLRRGRRNK